MKFNEVMAHYNYNITTIMRELNVARGTVNSWRDTDCVPFKVQCFLEIVTAGKLKANLEDKE